MGRCWVPSRGSTVRRSAGFRGSRAGMLGAGLMAVLLLSSLLAPWIAPHAPLDQSFGILQQPSLSHPFGTDELGRDVFSRVLHGLRASLLVAVATAVLAGLVGVFLGLIAGYLGGWVDAVVMRLMDMVLAFPAMLLAVVMVAVMGGGLVPLIIALTVVGVPPYARLTRAAVISIRERGYVTAQRAAGASTPDIMARTVLPNSLGGAAVQFVVAASTAVLTESGLSFLGLGLPPPNPALGAMLAAGNDNLFIAPWYALAIGLVITVVVVALDLLGSGLQRQFGAAARRSAVVA
ncbi:ABC transporter permease [Propionibacteriaceae bacterium Y1923]